MFLEKNETMGKYVFKIYTSDFYLYTLNVNLYVSI